MFLSRRVKAAVLLQKAATCRAVVLSGDNNHCKDVQEKNTKRKTYAKLCMNTSKCKHTRLIKTYHDFSVLIIIYSTNNAQNLNIIAYYMKVNATKYRHGCQCDVLNRPGQLKIEVWSPNVQLHFAGLRSMGFKKNKTISDFTGLPFFIFSPTV